MKAVLVGYGRMGRLLEARLLEKGHEVAAAVDPFFAAAGAAAFTATAAGTPVFPSLDAFAAAQEAAAAPDVAIEFTRPETAPGNIAFLAARRVPVVCGTTGWYELLPAVSREVEKAGSSLLWASNFSLGVNLFYRIAAYAARLIDPFPAYDVAGQEIHHNKKADSPSGTAKTLVEKVLAQMTRKTEAVYDKLDRPPEPRELHYASLRSGSVPGVHTLLFDSPADTIEIIHTARSRDGFADGAILAAEWLVAEARPGIFTMDDVI